MDFHATFCDPFKSDIVDLGEIPKNNVIAYFREVDWNKHLSAMQNVKPEDIYYSPSLEIENRENNNALSISAVGEPNNFEFYIFYKRPKQVKILFGLSKVHKENYLTDIQGQTEKDAIDCLNALVKGDLDFLEQKIK